MSQADYYQNGNHSACGTLNYPLSTTLTPLAGLRSQNKNSTDILQKFYQFCLSRHNLFIRSKNENRMIKCDKSITKSQIITGNVLK
ncbi:MAG: hypothetical protein LBE12_05010 [Planctomycetaceae bacterium]|nr:hypothetical protein [Planctomycetaceae bacterium]